MKKITISDPEKLIFATANTTLFTCVILSLFLNGITFSANAEINKILYEITIPGLLSFDFSYYRDVWVISTPFGILLTGHIILILYRMGKKFITNNKINYNLTDIFSDIKNDAVGISNVLIICLLVIMQVLFFPKLFWLIPLILALFCFFTTNILEGIESNEKNLFYLALPIVASSVAYSFFYSSIEFSFLLTGILVAINCLFSFVLWIIMWILYLIFFGLSISLNHIYLNFFVKKLINIPAFIKKLPRKMGISIQ